MSKLTALITTLALGASGTAMASNRVEHTGPARTSVEYRRPAPSYGNGVERFARAGSRTRDDFGPRRYRPTWVALDQSVQLGRGAPDCIEVDDRGTFTQLRLQTTGGIARVDRVIVQFADGSQQVAAVRRVLDDPSDLLEIPLDGNNRRIAKIFVAGTAGRSGSLELFAI